MPLYDESSGQVYTETVSAEVRSMIPAWSRHTGGRRVDPSKYKERWNGASSLKDTVMRSCLWHVNDMEPAALQWLGWHYACQIYTKLKQTDTLSFNAWSIFQRAFPEQIDRHHAFRYYESDTGFMMRPSDWTPVQLPSIVERFSRLDSSVLSFLCLQNLNVNAEDLFSLLKISSLAVLVLDPGIKGSSDIITSKNINSWGRAAGETGAFQKLRVLVLLGMASNWTVILSCALSFPSLVLFGTQRHGPGESHSKGPDGQWLKTDVLWWKTRYALTRDQTPQRIWVDQKTTKVAQMQLLYNLTTCSTPCTEKDSRVSLSYGWPQRNEVQAKEVVWFFRNRKHDAVATSKRSIDGPSLQQKTAAPDKKRKIREAKKADIGSFLDSFM